MVYIRIGGDNNNVAAVPAEFIHFGARHGQIWRSIETLCPVFWVGEQLARLEFIYRFVRMFLRHDVLFSQSRCTVGSLCRDKRQKAR